MMLNRVTIDTVMMSRDHAIKEPKSSYSQSMRLLQLTINLTVMLR